MPILTVADLVAEVARLRLLAASQQAELASSLAPACTEPKQLARELVQRGWLTTSQANRLILGHGAELVLGHYVLQERLGEGGMGAVFRARHQVMGRVVALKVIRAERLTNPEGIRRFQHEMLATAQ